MAGAPVARALILHVVITLLGAACFHESAPGDTRALAVWREIERGEAERAQEATAMMTPSGEHLLYAEQAYLLAVAASREVAIQNAEVAVEEANIMRARQLENPEMRLTNLRPGGLESGSSRLDIAVRVPIPRPWNLHAGARGARHATAAAQVEVEEAKRTLRARIFKLFARLARMRADHVLVEEVGHRRAKRRTIVSGRIDKAMATRLDLKFADIEYQEAAAEIARSGDRIAALESELRRTCGAGPHVQFETRADELTRGVMYRERVSLTEAALSRRPDVRAAASRVGAAEAGAYVARGSAWPWFGWAQLGHTLPAAVGAWGFGVTIEVPLLNWKRGQIRGADAQVRLRKLQEQASVQAVVHEIDEALERVTRTAAHAQLLETGVLAELREALDLAAKGVAARVIDPLDVVDLEIKQIEAQRRHLAATLEHREALIDLEAALGGPLP